MGAMKRDLLQAVRLAAGGLLAGASLYLAAVPLAQAQMPLDEVEAVYQELAASHLAAHQAEAARLEGIEPREGERLGTARPGLSRLSDKYWKRQAQLDEQVERTRKRFD